MMLFWSLMLSQRFRIAFILCSCSSCVRKFGGVGIVAVAVLGSQRAADNGTCSSTRINMNT